MIINYIYFFIMRLVYIVSLFIIILVALIAPRKEYFNLKEPCYKNIGNKNNNGDEITFNNIMLEDVLSKDSQIIKGDSYNEEITNNLREFDAQKKLAILDVQQKEASVAAEKSNNNNFFTLQEDAQEKMEKKILLEKTKLDQEMNNAQNKVSRYVYNRIMQDGQAKLSNTVQDIITKDITNIGLQLSKGENVPNYNFNGFNMLKSKFDSFTIDNTQIKVNNDKMVVPVKLLKPKGCYTVNDYDAILQWSPSVSGCESFGIKQKDYWKNNWNNFAVITSVDPGGKLPFATLGGKDVWLLETFTENSSAQDYVNSFNRTIFDWQSYQDPKGSFPIRVNPITTNIECLEKAGRCDTSFGSDMSKINNNANTIKCKFDDSDPEWCKKVYTEFAKKNIDSLNYNTCPIGWKVIDSSKNICEAGVNKSLQCTTYKPITDIPDCNNCKKIQRNDISSLIDKCDAQFRFKPNANAIANNQVGIKESADQSVRDVLGTSTKPISSNVDRFDFNKKGILVKMYEAVKSNNIIVKGPAVGPRNYGEGNTVYIVNNINFVNSAILLDSKLTPYKTDNYKTQQVFVEFLGYIKIPENTEKVTFQTQSFQGSRFYFQIGNELMNVIDSWSSPATKQSKTFNVKPNRFYPFKLEYFLDQGISNIKLLWRLNNETNFNVISRDNFFLDTEQCNKLTDIPQFNTTLDKEYKTFPGISAVNTSSIKMGNFETADECALNCSNYENCSAFTYSMDDKSCYQFDPNNPKFTKDEKTNTYIKNNTQSVYGSYDNSLEVPMRKMLTITDRDNSIQLSGLNEVLKKNFTIEMWINVDSNQREDIYLFSINPSGDKGEKIIFNLNKNRILDVDFGYPNNPQAIDAVGDINPMRQNNTSRNVELFADYQSHDISPNVWTHVAMTYSNNIVKIYVNGDKKKEIKQGPFTSLNNSLLAYIGRNGYRAYKLHIDEIRIWSIDLNTETLKSYIKKELDNTHPNKNNLVWYSNLNSISNKQIYNKCTRQIGSGCIQNIIAKFNKEPINITSESPLA